MGDQRAVRLRRGPARHATTTSHGGDRQRRAPREGGRPPARRRGARQAGPLLHEAARGARQRVRRDRVPPRGLQHRGRRDAARREHPGAPPGDGVGARPGRARGGARGERRVPVGAQGDGVGGPERDGAVAVRRAPPLCRLRVDRRQPRRARRHQGRAADRRRGLHRLPPRRRRRRAAAPRRRRVQRPAEHDGALSGDDEHVWTDLGVSNFEDGCYAKLIDLDKEAEPVIAAALSMKGTLIENVPPLPGKPIEETNPQELDLFDGSRTENTRFAYPLTCNPSVASGAAGPHPKTIVLLTADAFGVLPPVSILSRDEVMYHFVTGFTSKLAGTEVGVTKPEATFSACFGGPFMSQKPSVYAELLAKRMSEHDTRCILLNTGWTGGPHGVGSRMSLKHTRTLLNAALAGDFDDTPLVTQPILNLRMPTSCEGVPDEILNPRETWDDPSEYDDQATKLREMFRDNYKKENFADLGIAAVM